MMPALVCAYYFGSGGGPSIALSIGITLFVGATFIFINYKKRETDILPRESFLIVTGGWVLCSLFGALPFFMEGVFMVPGQEDTFSGILVSLTESVFESTSGLTTTGASVMTKVGEEGYFDYPHAILFWRSTNHWLGGMGIIVLSLAILPLLGAGGMQLFRAEVPGPTKDRLKPRIKDTAISLSKVYIFLTLAQTIALMFCGMNLYDALCHTFGTVATGGFSPHASSVGGFDSVAVNLVITFFMLVAGINFALHYRLIQGDWRGYFRNGECRTYLLMLGTAFLILSLLVGISNVEGGWGNAINHALFQAVSIMTTTGYGTADYEQWPAMAMMLLFFLMFVGGCAGSTGGGMKVIRIVLLGKIAYREMYRLLYPTAVVMIKQDGKTVPERVINAICGFFILAMMVFIISALLLSYYGIDYVTAMGATAACLFNIGPGLGLVGPTDHYAGLPVLVKWWLSFCMIIGRLEFYSILILTAPDFWRR